MTVQAHEIINAVRKECSEMYQQRIPIATRNNIKNVGDILLHRDNIDFYNEFIHTLLDKVAFSIIHDKIYTNPLAVLKNNTAGMPYGNKVEDVYIEPAKDVNFKKEVDSTIVLKTFHPNVKTAYYGMARKSTYASSFEIFEIQQAFTNGENFLTFFQGVINAMYSGDNIDEFLLMKNCLGAFLDSDVVNVIDCGDVATVDGSKKLLKTIGLYSRSFQYPSKLYSPYNLQLKALNPEMPESDLKDKQITTFCEKKDQILLITAEALNEITYEQLANVFNLKLTDLDAMIIEVDSIPSEKYKIDAVLMDKAVLFNKDYLFQMESEYIKGKMVTQYFLNHWGWCFASIFPNCIAFGKNVG